jgi:hypothetical protein
MKRRKTLKPYQVAAKWNHLAKAVQKSSRNWEERQNFWIDHKASLRMVVDQTIRTADDFDGRSTATVTHSLVKLLYLTNSKKNLGGGELQPLWDVLLHKTKLLLQSNGLNTHDVSNLLWAYAKAADGIKVDGRVLDALADRALIGIADFKPKALASTAWSFATLNHDAPLLLDAIARAAPARINDFNPQSLSNTAWAFATLNHEAPALLDEIARAAQIRINDFNPQDLSNTAWAFATLNHDAPLLLDAIARAVPAQINDFNPQIFPIRHGPSQHYHEAPALLDAIARAVKYESTISIHKIFPA